MRKALAGVGLAAGGILILMGSTGTQISDLPEIEKVVVQEPEPEPPVIKRAVDIEREPEPPVIRQAVESEPSRPKCDPSYPAICIPPSPPDLDCGEIGYSNFRVIPPDPHGFDGDKDGVGCEVGTRTTSEPVEKQPTQSRNQCDPSYPSVCIPPYPPDLDCGEIGFSNFKVVQPDPHRFDGDKDGIGCES